MKRLILIHSLFLFLMTPGAQAQESGSGMIQRLGDFARSVLGRSEDSKKPAADTNPADSAATIESSGSQSPGVRMWSNTNPNEASTAPTKTGDSSSSPTESAKGAH